MKKIISIFLCLIFIFISACQIKENNNTNDEELPPEEVVPTLVEKELTGSNFYNYITVKINQINQQSTHIRDEIIYGVTIKHYSILTTFSVTSISNDPSYIFENFEFRYRVGFDHNTNSLIVARLDINQDGSGYNTFTIIEYDSTAPYKNYTFQKYFGEFSGEFYELNISGKVKYYE